MPLEEQSASITTTTTTIGSEPRRKRAKIVSACGECRRKKTKCNGETPCRNCEKSGVHCIYPSSSLTDDKRNAPSKQALEAIEDRLKSIEDMLRAIIKTQNITATNDMDNVLLNNMIRTRDSPSPSPSTSPPIHLNSQFQKSSPNPASPIHLPSIRTLSTTEQQQQQQQHRDLPPLGFQNYAYPTENNNNNIDKNKRKR